jgi:glycine dehydrogenase subunit 2
MQLGGRGQRGYLPPTLEPEVASTAAAAIPIELLRATAPALPEIAQPEVYRHYLRLSQETMGAAVGFDTGQGTTTLKYNPPVNERVLRTNGIGDMHPLAEEDLVQGVLEVVYGLDIALRELSGMARFSLQPGGGTHGIYANACIIRAFHSSRGEGVQRDEMMVPILSHPGNAAAPRTAGFKVVTLYPGPAGYVEADAVRAAVSERTAGLMLSNPEDTGIFNPQIEEIIRIVHEAGGLCVHDQANANGLVGVLRSVDQGFDLTHYNLHKTFSTPHACSGPACGAIGATARLERYLPTPLVGTDGHRYFYESDRPDSIGRVRSFHGVLPNIVRAYTWIAAMGGDGLRKMAQASVLNNNYLALRLEQLANIRPSYADSNPHPRLEQIRYTLADLAAETGVSTDDISRRTGDFGVSGYFPSHHPHVIPEPATLEPTETASREDLDYYAWVIAEVVREARTEPERVRSSPERAPIHKTDDAWLDDPQRWALTWRAYRRKHALVAAGDHDRPR